MSIRLITMECPNCHAKLEIEEGRKSAYCTYCGAKFLIEDDSTRTTILITRDEAEIAKINADKEIRLKSIERAERKEKEKRQRHKAVIIASIIIVLLCFMLPLFVKAAADIHQKEMEKEGRIYMVYSSDDMRGQPTETVVKRLKKLGFSDIEIQVERPSTFEDQIDLLKYKKGDVIEVSANGSILYAKHYYKRDVKLIVHYKK